MKLPKAFKDLCTPAMVYFVISVLTILIALFNRVKLVAIGAKLLFALVWTLFLNYLCKQGYKSFSWLLVLLPYVMMILMGIVVLSNYSIIEGYF